MILHNEYLTDEELELLISETEDDFVPAPPEMADMIVNIIRKEVQGKENSVVEEKSSKNVQNKKTAKRREFAAYCSRVVMSVAAAIVFMCIVPNLPGFDGDCDEFEVKEYADKEAYLKENGNEPRQEVYTTYPTREEVLNDKSLMQRLLDGENIYKGMDVNLLRKRVGMVFQKPNPFPMSIYDNVAYGPRTHGIKNKVKLDEIVEKSLKDEYQTAL